MVYALEDDDGYLLAVIAWDTLAKAVDAKLGIQDDYNRCNQCSCVLSMRLATKADIDKASKGRCLGDNGTYYLPRESP